MSNKQPYNEKLKDPRWQRKRLEIFKRDEFRCQVCFDDSQMLCVHHLYYNDKGEPWEYDDKALITLCETCHQIEHEFSKQFQRELINAMKKKGFMSYDFKIIAEGFNKMQACHINEVMASSIATALENSEMLVHRYFDLLKNLKDG